jgi:Tol biopolymer transport system component
MPLPSGTRIGPYEIAASIGAGGMGEVYKARDTRLNRDVAIKVLPASFAEDPGRLRRFQLEAQSAGSLNHPNILTVHDIGTHENSPYLVSELLEGESLRDRLRGGKPPINKAVDYAKQIATGLAAAHAKGITHRDIKPENLFVTKDGRVKILDFGLAKVNKPAADGETVTALSAVGVVMGTAAYMSPEQARGQTVDHRSDIFSFGSVFYEMLSGERAFQGDTAADLMVAVVSKEPDSSGKMPPHLARIVQHCLEKSPDERFQSARDIAFDLESVAQQSTAAQAPVKVAKPQWTIFTHLALALVCAGLAWLAFRPQPERSFHRLTFRRGAIHDARFTPDGNSVVYSAQWEDEPSDVFTARFDTPGSRSLGFSGNELRAISSTGELALAQKVRRISSGFAPAGMLARAPFSGGATRAIEDGINFVDFSSTGADMAIVRESDQGFQLEYPAGKVLYKTAGYISEPRISPSGDLIAFLDHPANNDNRGYVSMVDRDGKLKKLTRDYNAAVGLAWGPKGDEIWFTAAKIGSRLELRGVGLSGKERLVYTESVAMILHDVSKDGRALISNVEQRTKLMFRGPSDDRDRELSWLDWSLIRSLSPDGKFVAFAESGEGAGAAPVSFLRETNGSPPVSLGTGGFPTLSPDGKFVVVYEFNPSSIVIYPVGPGQPKRILMPGFTILGAGLLADGKGIYFVGNEPSKSARTYLTDLDGAKPRPVTPEGVRAGGLIAGKYLVGRASGKLWMYPVGGGEPSALENISEGEMISGATEDGETLYVSTRNQFPAKIYRMNRRTGQRQLLREIMPADRAGIRGAITPQVTPDGKTYAYSTAQALGELHLVEGLK